MELDHHAPATPGKQGIDARGVAFAGVNLYVQLGRGRNYAWSATSAGQDNTDTFALELCDQRGPTSPTTRAIAIAVGACRSSDSSAPTAGCPTRGPDPARLGDPRGARSRRPYYAPGATSMLPELLPLSPRPVRSSFAPRRTV
jgi:Penicillin amidase